MKLLSISCLFLSFVILAILLFKKPKFILDPFSKCSVEDLIYTSVKETDFKIKISLYKSKQSDSSKAILLLPPTGGKNIIDEGYAVLFCKEGFDVHILESWSGDRGVEDYVLDFGIHQRYMTKTQKGIKLALENMNYENIGVLGTSAGAINFSVALSSEYVQKKVNAFFGIVGAMPLCKIIARAGEVGLEKVRKGRFKEFGFKSMSDYEDKICSVIDSKIPDKINEQIRYGAVIAKKDETVPYDLQLQQVKGWEPVVLKELDTSHIGAVIKSYVLYRREVVGFFL